MKIGAGFLPREADKVDVSDGPHVFIGSLLVLSIGLAQSKP